MTKKILIGFFSLLLLASCGKIKRNAKINRDCTGTYIEINNRDYLVCNPSMTNNFADGSLVRVKYKSAPNCLPQDSVSTICELYHKNSGIVEITEIRSK